MKRILGSSCLIAAALAACCGCGENIGTLTIVNTTLETANIGFNNKNFILPPEQHLIQKGLKPGSYDVRLGTEPRIKIDVQKKRATVLDIGENNCFIVADYTDQYGAGGTGGIKVVEKFVNQKNFTTAGKITSLLGEQLPHGVTGHKQITRLHRVDCSWINNDQAIVDAIANLP